MKATKIQTTSIFTKVMLAIEQGFRIISLQGSSRSGKTYNTLIALVVYLLKHPKTKLAIVRNTLPALKATVLEDFKAILETMNLTSHVKENKTTLTYTFPNGSWVEFFSTDEQVKLKGRKRDILYVNEATEISLIKWEQLQMRTTKVSIIDYNPDFSDEHWICDVNEEEGTHHFISTYKENPFLEEAIIKTIESYKTKNPLLWQIYGLGLRSVVEGRIFKEITEIDEIPTYAKKLGSGLDFGFTNDPTAIADVYVYDNNLYIDEVCYRTRMVTGDIVRVLKESCKGNRIIADCADPRLITEIFQAGVNVHAVKKGAGSVMAGINKMLEYKIHVTKRSVNGIKELKNYLYQKDKEGNWLNVPTDAFNHLLDAVRYIVLSELMGDKPRGIRKFKLGKT